MVDVAREIYRGVEIQNYQSRERIERRIRPQIDYVLGLSDIGELTRYAGNISKPPECRMLAAAMLEEIFAQAAHDRLSRPDVDLERVRAMTAGLEENSPWRSPWSYGSLLDVPLGNGPGPEMRPVELTDEQLGQR